MIGNQRLQKILELLTEDKDIVTGEFLCNNLGVSSRTVRSDIKELNKIIEKKVARIIIPIEKPLDVIDFNLKAINASESKLEEFEGYEKGVLCKSDYFTIEKYIINGKVSEVSNENEFFILTCVDGNGKILSENNEEVIISKGDSIFIPASLGNYIIEGKLTLLKSYI